MAKLIVQPATRFSNEQWHSSNAHQVASSEAERSLAERRRAEAERLRKETDQRRERTQQDVSRKFSQRIADLQEWAEQVKQQSIDVQAEITNALECKSRLEAALQATMFPLEVTTRCLAFREKREGIDLVHDRVEVEILKEKDIEEGVQALLTRNIEQMTEQIRLLRSRDYHLQKDLKDKSKALQIDSLCSELDSNSQGIDFYSGAVMIDAKSVNPDEWELFSDNNIAAAERERHASAKLRAVADDVLRQTSNDLSTQRISANDAFDRRIEEMTEAKENFEKELDQVKSEQEAMNENVSALASAIEAKMPAMKLSHTRLEERSYRPNVELVRDPLQYRLVGEVAELQDSIECLQAAYADAMRSLEGLRRRRLDLEEDIRIKTLSLHIDQNQCMALRHTLPDLW